MPAVNEHHVVEGRRLGRRPPSNRPALRLDRILTGVVPTHPAVVNHFDQVTDWGMYGNNSFGDCGPVSVANSVKLLTRAADPAEVSVTLEDVFDLYRRSGNPNFDPATDADDNGVDMQTMLDALLKGGIGGRKPLAFAKVDVSDLNMVRAAISIFGCVLYGVNLLAAQQSQTDHHGPWDYVANSPEWGGHAIVAGRYTSSVAAHTADTSVITWAEEIGVAATFEQHQLEEAWVVIWPEHVAHPSFQQGIDMGALAADFKALTGRDFPNVTPPIPTPPGPSPTPVPGGDAPFPGADAAVVPHILAKAHEQGVSVSDWLNHHFRSVFHVH